MADKLDQMANQEQHQSILGEGFAGFSPRHYSAETARETGCAAHGTTDAAQEEALTILWTRLA